MELPSEKYDGKLHTLKLLSYFKQHPAMVVSTAYLILSLLGLLYIAKFFEHFDVPVLHFIDIADLFAVGFREPMALVMLASALLLGIFVDWTTTVFFRLKPKIAGLPNYIRFFINPLVYTPKTSFGMTLVMIPSIIIYIAGFVFIFADMQAQHIKTKQETDFSVTFEDQRFDAYLLGSSVNFLFVYDPALEKARVLNLENVSSLEPIVPLQEETPEKEASNPT